MFVTVKLMLKFGVYEMKNFLDRCSSSPVDSTLELVRLETSYIMRKHQKNIEPYSGAISLTPDNALMHRHWLGPVSCLSTSQLG